MNVNGLSTQGSGLLELPTELRLHIFRAVFDHPLPIHAYCKGTDSHLSHRSTLRTVRALLLASRQINSEFKSILFDHIELIVELTELYCSCDQLAENGLPVHLGFKILFDNCTDERYTRGKATLEPLLKKAKRMTLQISPDLSPIGRDKECRAKIFDDATWVIKLLNSSKSTPKVVIEGQTNQFLGHGFGLGGLGTDGGYATDVLKSQLKPFDMLRNTELEVRVCAYGDCVYDSEEQTKLPEYIATLKAKARRPIEAVNDDSAGDVELVSDLDLLFVHG